MMLIIYTRSILGGVGLFMREALPGVLPSIRKINAKTVAAPDGAYLANNLSYLV